MTLLVIATVEKDGSRVKLLECKQGQRDLNAAIASVDKVAIEQIWARGCREAVRAEDVHQVLELPVEVAHDGERGAFGHFEVDNIRQRA
jgi:hypothetical protein